MKVMNPFSIVAILIFVVTLASCDRATKYAVQINSIDSCLTQIDSLEQIFKGIEFDSLKLMVAHVKENEAIMKQYYHADTIDLEIGMLLNNGKGIRKSIDGADQMKLVLGNEIIALRKQFTNLKTDILNGAVDEAKMNTYLADEKAALLKFKTELSEYNEIQTAMSATYYYSTPILDAFISTLNIPDADTLQ